MDIKHIWQALRAQGQKPLPDTESTAAPEKEVTMYGWDIKHMLQTLRSQGQKLLQSAGPRAAPEIDATRAWVAVVNDILRGLLSPDSSLLKELDRINSQVSERDHPVEEGSLSGAVNQVNRILEHVEQILQLQRLQEQTIRFSDEEKNRLAESLENKVGASIVEKYFKSWQIRVPVLLFIGAATLAVFGVIRIGQYSVDLEAKYAEEVKKVTQAIQAQAADVKANIDALYGSETKRMTRQVADVNTTINHLCGLEKTRITGAVDEHIEKLKAEKAPHAEKSLEDLTTNLGKSEERLVSISDNVQALEKRTSVVEKTVAAATAQLDNPSVVKGASAILRTSLVIIVVIGAASGLAMVLSIIALWKSAKHS